MRPKKEVKLKETPGDCTNPDCPYRAVLEEKKAKHRERVKNWRSKTGRSHDN